MIDDGAQQANADWWPEPEWRSLRMPGIPSRDGRGGHA